MKAAVLTRPSTFKIKNVNVPDIVKEFVPLKVSACGICGSDLAIYPKDPPIPFYWPGHEISGYAGDQLYVVNPLIHCAECSCCRSGKVNLCEQVKMVSHHLPGGFAEYVYVPESSLKAIHASPEVATLVEPVASSLHAIGKARISKEDKVVIVGGGLIGLLILQLLHLQGLEEVTLIAKYDFQQKLALKWNSVKLNAIPDIVILAVGGDGSALQYAVDTVKPQGKVIAMGNIYHSCPLNLKWLVEHEVLVSGSQRYLNHEFDQAAEIIEKNLIDLRPLITHEFCLEEITKAFETAKDKMAHQSIKVLIKPGEK